MQGLTLLKLDSIEFRGQAQQANLRQLPQVEANGHQALLGIPIEKSTVHLLFLSRGSR
jgi:hypothetical protein